MTAAEFRSTLRSLGLSQRSLAGELGLAVSTVSRWANDQAPVPKYGIAYLECRAENIRLAKALRAIIPPAARKEARRAHSIAANALVGTPISASAPAASFRGRGRS